MDVSLTLEARRQRALTRAASHTDIVAAKREELGRLLDLVGAQSEGGYVQIRFSYAGGAPSVGGTRHGEWRVNIRTGGREYMHRGRELGSALYYAAYRLYYGRRPKEEFAPPIVAPLHQMAENGHAAGPLGGTP